MNFKNQLRSLIIRLLKEEHADYIRYLRFSRKIRDLDKFKKKHYEVFEPEMEILEKLLFKKYNTWLDIGANYGSYSYLLSKFGNKETRIFAFEPIPNSYRILSRIIRKFNLKNVYPVNMAIGEKEGNIEMETLDGVNAIAHISFPNSSDYWRNIYKEEKKIRRQKVKIIKIDNFLNKAGIKGVDFIKCDVEGKELDVFKGAIKTIRKYHPIILCEAEQELTRRYGIDADELIHFLAKLNYETFGYKDKRLIRVDKVSSDHKNYIFINKATLDQVKLKKVS